jgi:hypothetical protein
MTITLNVQTLVDDIFAKSHYGTSHIESVDQRFDVEAGSDKKDDIARCLAEANAVVVTMCSRFLDNSDTDAQVNNTITLPENITYTFKTSQRRYANRKQAYVEIIHSLLVNMTLFKYYNDVSHGDLATKHDNLAKGDMAMLERLLYEKTPPIPPTRYED